MEEGSGPVSSVDLKSARRYLFIDLYRSAIILLMLEGHLFRVLLQTDIQKTAAFQIHEFFHGLSAPAFLFGAGLTFVISTRRRWNEYHHWDPPLARRVRRLLLVLMLGIGLHLPFLSIRRIVLESDSNNLLQLFQFDILHCISIGLFSLHCLIFFFKTEKRFYHLVLTAVLAVCFSTPLIWEIDFLKFLHVSIAQSLNGNHGSPFPIFPYVGFLYAGVIVSWEFLLAVQNKREKIFMVRLALTGISLIMFGIISDMAPVRIYPTYNYWFTSPSYFILRTGSLLLIVSVFWYIADRIKAVKKIWTILGIESLFVYVLHLLLLYGSVINPEINLRAMLGSDLPLYKAIGLFFAFFLLMLGIALFWNRLKSKYFKFYRFLQITAGTIFLYFFLT